MPLNFLYKYKKILLILSDIIIIIIVSWLSFFIRFDSHIPEEYWSSLQAMIFLSLAISLPIFYWQRLYQFSLTFIGINELYRIIKAVTLSSIFIAATLFILRDAHIFSGFPRSIIFINYFLVFLMISSARLSKRILIEIRKKSIKSGKRIIIIGAGESGVQLSRALSKNLDFDLVGFIDDSNNKNGTFIYNYPVLGKRENIPNIVKKFSVKEVIIAFPSAGSKIIRETVDICRKSGIKKIKILPSLSEIINGKLTLANIRDVSIEDLLGRDRVFIDTKEMRKFISNKNVLITGAAGSIGSHLCEEILKFNPAQLVAFDQNETGIFKLGRNLDKRFPDINKIYEIGDICDKNKINNLFANVKPDVVFHAAAYKHVPVMESHPDEAVKNNIIGTFIVSEAAAKNNVDKFIFISTDKAINPTSVMGVSKRVGEMICCWQNRLKKTKFCAVRFGNVLDSQGNVVGIFDEQIKAGGPVEITHPEMKRYFMVTSEACLLVMEAGAISEGGEVFVLDMGDPVKIVDLAKEMIRLSGYKPDNDIPIIFTQPRPGEKLVEEILVKGEIPTSHKKIFITRLKMLEFDNFENQLLELINSLNNLNKSAIIAILKKIVPTYKS